MFTRSFVLYCFLLTHADWSTLITRYGWLWLTMGGYGWLWVTLVFSTTGKKLHAFVKVSIEIIPISFWAGPITENVNQVPLSLIKIYLLFKKMNEMIFTDSFSRELFRRLDLYY